jgi:uncharacterized protein (UPF0297 family)
MITLSKKLEYIINCISETGFDPYMQIYGYLQSNDDIYITRNGNARDLIKFVDRAELEKYVSERCLHS